MKKSNRPFIILIGVMFLVFITMILYITAYTRQIIPFGSDSSKVLKETLRKDNKISPIEVAKLIVGEDENVVFVDIRSNYEFAKGHLPKAKNIYKADILDKENYKYFDELKAKSLRAILYGSDVVEANIPFMILKQTGIENIVLMNGGYHFFENVDINSIAEMGDLDLDDETTVMDFSELIASEKNKELALNKKEKEDKIKAKKHSVVVVKKKKIAIKKRSVKPKKKTSKVEEEEEDEGC